MKIPILVTLSTFFLSNVYAEELYCAKRYVNTGEVYQFISLKKIGNGWLLTGTSNTKIELDQCEMAIDRNDPVRKFLFECKGAEIGYEYLFAGTRHTYETTISKTTEYIQFRLKEYGDYSDFHKYDPKECSWLP